MLLHLGVDQTRMALQTLKSVRYAYRDQGVFPGSRIAATITALSRITSQSISVSVPAYASLPGMNVPLNSHKHGRRVHVVNISRAMRDEKTKIGFRQMLVFCWRD